MKDFSGLFVQTEISLPQKLPGQMELCMIIVDFICRCALVPMCLCQGQPGPQPLLYFLSFRFKFVFAAVGQVLQQQLVRVDVSERARSLRQR